MLYRSLIGRIGVIEGRRVVVGRQRAAGNGRRIRVAGEVVEEPYQENKGGDIANDM